MPISNRPSATSTTMIAAVSESSFIFPCARLSVDVVISNAVAPSRLGRGVPQLLISCQMCGFVPSISMEPADKHDICEGKRNLWRRLASPYGPEIGVSLVPPLSALAAAAASPGCTMSRPRPRLTRYPPRLIESLPCRTSGHKASTIISRFLSAFCCEARHSANARSPISEPTDLRNAISLRSCPLVKALSSIGLAVAPSRISTLQVMSVSLSRRRSPACHIS